MEGFVLQVKVRPKAKTNKIIGWEGEVLKVSVAAPPEKGAANRELVRFLAKEFGLAQRDIVLLSGETSRLKRLLLPKDPKAQTH